jgi:hypothetical protein
VQTLLVFLLLCWAPGEELEYDVRYGPLSLGTLELTVAEPESIGGTLCHHLRADLVLSRSFSWLFSARYRLESWCRDSDMVTLRSYKRTREPNYRAEWTADYDASGLQVRYSDGQVVPLKGRPRDLLTTWYYLRTLQLETGDTVRAALHVDRKNYALTAVAGRRRQVRTPSGDYDCIAVSPNAGTPLGTVYLSDDPDRLPAVIRTRVGGLVVAAYLREAASEELE